MRCKTYMGGMPGGGDIMPMDVTTVNPGRGNDSPPELGAAAVDDAAAPASAPVDTEGAGGAGDENMGTGGAGAGWAGDADASTLTPSAGAAGTASAGPDTEELAWEPVARDEAPGACAWEGVGPAGAASNTGADSGACVGPEGAGAYVGCDGAGA